VIGINICLLCVCYDVMNMYFLLFNILWTWYCYIFSFLLTAIIKVKLVKGPFALVFPKMSHSMEYNDLYNIKNVEISKHEVCKAHLP